MATVTIYCTAIHNWNSQYDYWEEYSYPISGSYKEKPIPYLPTQEGYRHGVQRMTFEALPIGTITDATFNGQSWKYSGSSNNTIYYRASDDEEAWHSDTPPSPVSKYLSFTTTRTAFDFDITSQITSYGVAGSALYVYAFKTTNLYVEESHVWDSNGYLPYIDITYTPPTDSQFYLGTADGNKVCDMYIGVGGVAKKVTDIYIGTAGGNKRIEL